MTKQSIGKGSEAQASATGRAVQPEATSGEFDRADAALGELVQRLARDGRPGANEVQSAAAAMQRLVGNRSTTRMLASRSGGGSRSVREVARSGFEGGGRRLPFMSQIQESFGAHDLSGVRSFTGAGAAAASRSLSAQAYASGDRVAFADATPSLRTVAHEAAHVIQQRAGIHLPGGVDRGGDRHERHADAVADKVVRGESAERSLDTYFAHRRGGAAAPARGGEVGVQRSLGGALAEDVDSSKDDAKQTSERYAAILEKLAAALEAKRAKGEKLTINPDAVLAPMINRLEKRDGDTVYSTYDHLIEALKARGAILIDGKESGKSAPRETDKFTINLLLPGSGDRRWRTFAENMLGDDGVATRKAMFAKMKEISGDDKKTRDALGVESGKKVFPTLYVDESATVGAGVTYMIRGPGSTDSTSSHPSNSIASNLKTAKSIVESYLKDWPDKRTKVRIMGHSRNGVTAAMLVRDLRSEHPELEIEAVIFDPVPGGDAKAISGYEEATLPDDAETDKDVDSTVIYSLLDDRVGFNPLKVYGAKRLILTHYSHHAGIEPGFTYKGKHLKGLGLLDLPPGLFIDQKMSAGKPNDLDGPVSDWDTIKIVLTAAMVFKDSKNKNRLDVIRQVVEAFLGTKPAESSPLDLETK